MPFRWVLIILVILFMESEVRRIVFQADSSSSLLSQANSSKYISLPFMIGDILGFMVLLGMGVLGSEDIIVSMIDVSVSW